MLGELRGFSTMRVQGGGYDNLRMVGFLSDHFDDVWGGTKVVFVAKHTIEPMSELCFNYSTGAFKGGCRCRSCVEKEEGGGGGAGPWKPRDSKRVPIPTDRYVEAMR